jgi:hypothetical protein
MHKAFCIVITFIALCLLGCDGLHQQQMVLAHQNIKIINAALKEYYNDMGSLPDVTSATSFEETNSKVMKVLTEGENIRLGTKHLPYININSRYLNAKGALIDPWGMPYFIKLGDKKDTEIKVGRRNIKEPWAVWSSGENRINEWGDGDDIW